MYTYMHRILSLLSFFRIQHIVSRIYIYIFFKIYSIYIHISIHVQCKYMYTYTFTMTRTVYHIKLQKLPERSDQVVE